MAKIFEELPKRKHPIVPDGGGGAPAQEAPPSGGGQETSGGGSAPKSDSKPSGGSKEKGATEENESKRIRQAVYDIRYRARREDIDLRQAFSQYMQNSGLSQAERTAVRGKLFGKEGGSVSERYSDAGQLVSDNVAKALNKVFSEGADAPDKKYKVRVTDKKTGRSYIRFATREKITQLRSNPNIQSVEMTEHGEPYEGGRTTDPREPKKRVDKEVKKDEKKEQNEEFIADANSELVDDKSKDEEIDVMKGKNTKVIKINPKIGEEVDVKKTNEKDPNGDAKKEEDEDYRSMKTRRNNMLNKLRARGLNMSHNLEGEVVEAIERQAKDRKKLSQPHSVSGSRRDHSHDVDSALTDYVPGKGKGRVRPASTKEMRVSAMRDAGIKEEFELNEEFITERVDFAVDYFFNEGINEDGLNLIVEEVGLDTFLEFVLLEGPQQLNEDEAAYQKAKKKAIKGSDKRESEGKGEYSPKGSKSPYAKQGIGAKTKKKPRIGAPSYTTKVVSATKKAKAKQPDKPASKEKLGGGIRGFIKRGQERHSAAVSKAKGEIKKIAKTASDTAKQHSGHRKKFVSGLKATPKERKIAGGIGKAVKRAVVGEEVVDEAQELPPNIAAALSRLEKKRVRQGGDKKDSPYNAHRGKKLHPNQGKWVGPPPKKEEMNYTERLIDILELNRYEKETGKSSGGVSGRSDVNTPRKGTPTKTKEKPTAVSVVKSKTMRPMTGRPQGQKKSDYAKRHQEQDRPETPARTMQRRRYDPRDEVEKATQGRYSKNSRYD